MIMNLTQHPATAEQIAAGVVDLAPALRTQLQALLTFDRLPTGATVDERALQIVQLIHELEPAQAMIGGAPYLMPALEAALSDVCIETLYSFSERVSEEQTQPDGSVRKVNVFRHIGFVPGGYGR